MSEIATIISDAIVETLTMNTPEGYVRIGERVVEALVREGITLVQPHPIDEFLRDVGLRSEEEHVALAAAARGDRHAAACQVGA